MRKMKDSVIEWIGEIPESWDTIKLNYLFKTIGSGTTPNTGNGMFYDGKYNWLQTGDLTDGIVSTTSKTITQEAVDTCSALTLFKKGAVVIAMYGATIGKLGILDIDCYTNQACCALSEPIDTDSKFVYYWLLCNKENIVRLSLGGGQHNISQGIITSLKVSIPASVTEQSRIADYLDKKCAEIDALIAAKERTNALLRERRQSIIYDAVTKGLDPTVPMKDSGVEWIGEIPESWSVGKTLYGLSMPITDGPHETPELLDEGIPFVSAEAVSSGNGKIDFDHIRGYISKDYYQECCKKYTPAMNDIYMIKSGATTGKVALVDTDRIFTIWSPLAVFRCNEKKCFYKYLYYFLQSDSYQKQLENNWSFGTQQNIGMRTLEKLIICYPNIDEQKCISTHLDQKCTEIDGLIAANNFTIKKLKEYRQSVIYEAVTGKVEI